MDRGLRQDSLQGAIHLRRKKIDPGLLQQFAASI